MNFASLIAPILLGLFANSTYSAESINETTAELYDDDVILIYVREIASGVHPTSWTIYGQESLPRNYRIVGTYSRTDIGQSPKHRLESRMSSEDAPTVRPNEVLYVTGREIKRAIWANRRERGKKFRETLSVSLRYSMSGRSAREVPGAKLEIDLEDLLSEGMLNETLIGRSEKNNESKPPLLAGSSAKISIKFIPSDSRPVRGSKKKADEITPPCANCRLKSVSTRHLKPTYPLLRPHPLMPIPVSPDIKSSILNPNDLLPPEFRSTTGR